MMFIRLKVVLLAASTMRFSIVLYLCLLGPVFSLRDLEFKYHTHEEMTELMKAYAEVGAFFYAHKSSF